jgi:hypothetical protein
MHPRHFLLWAGHLIVAHEKGNRVTVLKVDGDRCAGACVESLPIARPAFIGVC